MKKLKPIIISLLSVALFSACNSLTNTSALKQKAKTQLSFQNSSATALSPTAPASPAASGGSYATVASTSSSTIKIDTAKVLIDKIEFHGKADSTEFEAGPFVLDLNMDTTVTTLAVKSMPHGTYTEVSFKIHKQRPNQTVLDSDFVSGPNESHRYSVVVKGFYNGKHFVFKSQRTAEEHIHINPPLIISDTLSSYNATIKVNVNSWFVSRNGSTLDPTIPDNAEAINRAIERSFRGIKDNNHDGHEDSNKTEKEHHDHNSKNSSKDHNSGNSDSGSSSNSSSSNNGNGGND